MLGGSATLRLYSTISDDSPSFSSCFAWTYQKRMNKNENELHVVLTKDEKKFFLNTKKKLSWQKIKKRKKEKRNKNDVVLTRDEKKMQIKIKMKEKMKKKMKKRNKNYIVPIKNEIKKMKRKLIDKNDAILTKEEKKKELKILLSCITTDAGF